MTRLSVWGAAMAGVSALFKPGANHPDKNTNPQKNISFFEVKELHNLAYERKAEVRAALRAYRQIEAEAKEMDTAYRAQLGLVRRAA